ncbi:myosin-16-like isoform X2 [Micropterus salmoides]|uniref:myosin-16-like isoform X2 n=1 Tax=Micropterus salmoides TaxID=27706 RepID=UPI0018EB9B48|nr:myosin-16-like isoform X2 [Micropterus salmoides]
MLQIKMMDFKSCTKITDARTSTPRQVKTSEKQTAEDGAKHVLDSHDKLSRRQKPLSKPGLSLEKKIEQEKRRRHVLINEHNRLTFAVKTKEAKLKELQEQLKAMSLQPTNYNCEDTCEQRIRQLENNLDKMKLKTTQAKRIQTAYWHILEHLQQEVRGMYKILDQKAHAVAVGQAEVDKATQKFQSAAAAADSTLGKMVQVENETMEKKSKMDSELGELTAEENELKRNMKTLGRLSPKGQSRLKEREIEEKAQSIPVTDHQYYDICGASQSDMKLVEDMEALREILGCADIQDLVNKVVSQQATKEQLQTEVTHCEELVRQEAKTLADLELLNTELKFNAKPTTTRFDKLKEQMQAKLSQKVDHVQRLQAKLQQSQGLLDTVEQGVTNVYFRMSCVLVEGLPSASSTNGTDKLGDISARLPTLLQIASKQKPEISGLDKERVYSLLEQLNMMGMRNNKRQTTPLDTPQLSEDEEECVLSREEIKRNSSKLIESKQKKKNKSSRKGKRKQ